MGYTGTIVVGWSAGLLVHEDGMDGFGHQHRYVRPLGDGWQLVETGGLAEEPGLREPCRRLARSTGRSVLAAQVFDSDFALLCTAAGDLSGPVTRVLDDENGCNDRPVGDVVGELVGWAEGAGLRADPAAVLAALTLDRLADDAVFDLVRALGVATIGRTLPRAFGVEGWPFSPVSGLAYQARMLAAREEREPEPPAPWQGAAITLDAEMWAAAYRPPVDVASLGRRAVDVLARGKTGKWRDDLDLLNALLAGGRLGDDDHERSWADRRAAER